MSKAGGERARGFFSGGAGRPPWWGDIWAGRWEMMACLPAPGEEVGVGGRELSGGTDHSSEQARRLMEGFKQSNDIILKSHFGCCVESSLWRDRGWTPETIRGYCKQLRRQDGGFDQSWVPQVAQSAFLNAFWRRRRRFYWWIGGKGHQTRLQDFSATAERMGGGNHRETCVLRGKGSTRSLGHIRF